jgi:nudix-type nucleoside diphosphatase (YffH/AdpP family)
MIDHITLLGRETLSDHWYHLYKYTFDLHKTDGSSVRQVREVYDRGNGSTILLYNRERQTVILTRQFRLPTFVNGNPDGFMVEACAGLLDGDNPEECIRRETEEETGYQIKDVRKVFEAYMSPGSVTEILYFFLAEYEPAMKTSAGGGADGEEENIQVLEIPFAEVVRQLKAGEIKDAKTILLLQHLMLEGLMDK